MKKCLNCGRLETDSTGFCPDCGSSNFEPLIKDDSTSTNQTQAPASAPESAFDSLKSQDTPLEATASPVEANSTPNSFATSQPTQPQGTGENYSYNGQTPNGAYGVNANQGVYNNPNSTNNTYVTGTVTHNPVMEEDKTNVGLVILSVLIPIVGIILWAVKKKETPKAAKSYGLAGLIVIIVNVILSIVISIAMFAGGFAILDKALELSDDYDSSYSEDYDYEDSDDMTVEEDETEAETEKATESSAASSVKFASNKWVDMDNRQFAINGKVYTLGKTTLQDMIDDGVPFEKDDIANANNNLNKNTISKCFEIKLDEYWHAQVAVANYTDKNMVIKDCPISTIFMPNRDGDTQNILKFAFPLTMTESELKENAGEPSDTSSYSSNGYVSNIYKYKKESEKYYQDSGYEFEFINGKLQYVTIDLAP